MDQQTKKSDLDVLMISTQWDENRCGIGLYTKYLSEEEREQGINVYNAYLYPNTKNPITYLMLALKSTKTIQIIHIQFDYPFFGKIGPFTGIFSLFFFPLLWFLTRFTKSYIIISMHEVWDKQKPPKFGKLGSLYGILLNMIIGTFSHSIIVLSATAKKRLSDQYVQSSKIRVINHGIFSPIFIDKSIAKRRLAIDSDTFVITIFGFIKKTKGHDLLINASKSLDKNVLILVAGGVQSEHDRPFLGTLQDQPLSNIRYYGFVHEDEIPLILNSTDIMVLPYREITQSGVLNWSLAYQIPTITSDLPFFKEINRQCSCIMLFESENISSLVSSIRRIQSDEEIRKSLQYAERKYYEKNSFSQKVTEIIQLYRTFY